MEVPAQVGAYRTIGLLGRGGFAVVYAAEDERDGSPAAVKIPVAETGTVQSAWIRREASLAARLRHPNIVQLLASGALPDGVPYLVFERIDGPTLERMADTLDAAAIVSVGVQLLEALGYAHDAGVVHCDIKPENVLVPRRDARGRPVVRLLDFGLATTKAPGAQDDASMPLVAGTPGYISPEQARGAGRVAPQSDIYSCGALLYRLIAGFPPHFGGTTSEIMRRTMGHEPLPLRPRPGLEVPEALLAVVGSMLERDPSRRPASAYRAARALREAARDLSWVRDEEVTGNADTLPPSASGVQHATVQDPSTEAATVARSSAREPFATPAVAISRHIGRRAPLLGRAEELERLMGACTGEVAGRDERPVVRVVGALGTGRTRLLREVVSRVRSRGWRIFQVTGRRGVRSPPFEVLSALTLDLIGAEGVSPPWIAAERLSNALREAGVPDDDAGRDALIAGLVGVGLPTAVGHVRRSAYRAFLALLGPRRDEVLLVVDDAEQIDEDSLGVLESLAHAPDSVDGSGAPRVLMALTEPLDAVEPGTRLLDVPIGPLDRDSSVRMIAALTDRVPGSLEPAASEAGGVPAELTEAAAAIVSPEGPVDGPLLERRWHALTPRVRAILCAAAVWPGDAPVRSLHPMATETVPDLDEQSARASMDRLLLDGLLVRPTHPAATLESITRFTSERMRQRVLASLDDDTRGRLHGAAARWLVRESHDASHGMQAVLAEHAEAARDLATAAWAHATAGRLGAATGRAEASAHLAMALTLARSSDEASVAVDEPGLLGELASLAIQRGESETAELFALQSLSLVEAERTTLRARLHRMIAEAHVQRRNLDTAMEHLDGALELLGDEGDPIELATALASKGWLLGYLRGRNEEGIALGLRAREVAARIDAPRFRASLCGRLGANFLRAGDWNGQLATNLEDLGLSTAARDVGGVIRANINLGVCYVNRGLPALARAHTEHALDLSRRYDHRVPRQISLNNLAMIAVDEGRLEDAEAFAREMITHAERTGVRGGLGETWTTLARVQLLRGDRGGAERALDEAAPNADGVVDEEMIARVRALLEVARGRPDLAIDGVEQIVEGPVADPYERANTRLCYARALADAGRPEEARAQERLADEAYERLGADPAHERRRWQPDLRGTRD